MPDNLRTVVLAEDDDFFMKPFTYALEDEKYKVIPAETIASLEKNARQANVLVVDARMSDTGLAGVACAAKLITDGKVSAKVPLVFVSVLSEHDDSCQEEIRKHSALAKRYVWLQKYFETDLLIETIREEIQKRSSLA